MDYLTPLQNLSDKLQKHPDKPFLHQPIEQKWQKLSWADVDYQARCIATGLVQQGFVPGSRIGILAKNCAHWIISDLAIMMAGMISVPIYSSANRETISYIIRHAQLKAVFVGKLDNIKEADIGLNLNPEHKVLRIALPYPTVPAKHSFADWLISYSPLKNIHQPQIDDMATIVYTSGSTGVPKGVVLTHKNWASAAQHTAEKLEICSADRILSYLPLAHVVERSLEAVTFYVGCQVYFAESLDTFIDDLKYAKPTIFGSVPRLWSKFQAKILATIPAQKLAFLLSIPLLNKLVIYKIKNQLGLQESTRFITGTAPISQSVLEWYAKINIPISEAWGMTESSSLSCVNLPFDKKALGTIGKPLKCVEMKLSGESEILIRGDAVFSEYYQEAEITTESFEQGWFKTGDCAEMDSHGNYKIIGRIKDQFKTSKGKYVTPVPIENSLCANLDIDQVCVVGSGLKQPIALVVLFESTERKSKTVINRLKSTFNTINEKLENHQKLDYMLICRECWTVENGLLTPTLKIKRNDIEQRYKDYIREDHQGQLLWQEDLDISK